MGAVYGAFFAGPFVQQLLLEPLVSRISASVGLATIAASLVMAQVFRHPAVGGD